MLAAKSCSKAVVIKTGLAQHANGIVSHVRGNFVNDSGGDQSEERG